MEWISVKERLPPEGMAVGTFERFWEEQGWND